MGYPEDANADVPPAYEVEFADADGITRAEHDLEVGWRPDSGS